MEWVETTGRTIEEAKDIALDQLGVDEDEAEFEILEEPRPGLFGRVRGEARVRARVRPTRPPAKVDRRDRRRRRGGGVRATGSSGAGDGPSTSTEARAGRAPGTDEAASAAPVAVAGEGAAPLPEQTGPARATAGADRGAGSAPQHGGDTDMSEATLREQADVVEEFLDGLLDAFGLDGEIHRLEIDEDTVEVQITGPDLGLLIGPKGATLTALQELARTVVQRRADGPVHGRVRLDVAGYRQKRREALQRFTREVAEQVRSSGVQKALEPMTPADRKIVHDTVNEIDGVTTVSEGEEPRRRVVIVPAP